MILTSSWGDSCQDVYRRCRNNTVSANEIPKHIFKHKLWYFYCHFLLFLGFLRVLKSNKTILRKQNCCSQNRYGLGNVRPVPPCYVIGPMYCSSPKTLSIFFASYYYDVYSNRTEDRKVLKLIIFQIFYIFLITFSSETSIEKKKQEKIKAPSVNQKCTSF